MANNKAMRQQAHSFKHLFGPVPSRRLGLSLGVDLVPYKTCTLNCIYCESGATNNLTHKRQEFIPTQDIMTELSNCLSKKPALDYITFSGSGEPTLAENIGEVISYIKSQYPEYKCAVLTNGTLLWDKKVQDALYKVDLVIPSLDAACKPAFEAINRPTSKIELDPYLDGLLEFSKCYQENNPKGQIWLEIFILPGFNDSVENMIDIKNIVDQLNPNKIQLNTLDRPGTEANIHAATEEELKKIAKTYFESENIEIIAKPKATTVARFEQNVIDQIIATITRRPCTQKDLAAITGLSQSEIRKCTAILCKEGKIEIVRQNRGEFYLIKK